MASHGGVDVALCEGFGLESDIEANMDKLLNSVPILETDTKRPNSGEGAESPVNAVAGDESSSNSRLSVLRTDGQGAFAGGVSPLSVEENQPPPPPLTTVEETWLNLPILSDDQWRQGFFQQLQGLRQQVQGFQQQLARSEDVNARLMSHGAQYEMAYGKTKQRLDSVTELYFEWKSKAEELQQSNGQMTLERDAANAKVGDLASSNAELSIEVGERQKELCEAKKRITSAEQEAAAMKERLAAQVAEETAELRAQLEAAEADKKRVGEELETLSTTAKRIRGDNIRLSAELHETKTELTAATETLQAATTRAEADKKRAGEELEKVSTTAKRIREDNIKLSAELHETTTKLTATKAELDKSTLMMDRERLQYAVEEEKLKLEKQEANKTIGTLTGKLEKMDERWKQVKNLMNI